jgi:mannosyltransferase
MEYNLNWKEWNREWIIIALITIGGALLRIYNIDYNSLWLDEAYTFNIARLSFGSIWSVISSTDFTPPLFYWLENLMLMAGNNETILRLLPALFGIATIPVIYYVGKEFADEFAGFIIASAFAVSPLLVAYSQEARPYSMLVFMCSLMMFTFLRAIRTNNTNDWALFTILAAFAFWTHYYSILFTAALLVFAIYKFRETIQQQWKILAGCIVIWIGLTWPLIIGIIDLLLAKTETNSWGDKGIDVILQFFMQLSGYSVIPLLMFLLLFGIGISWLWKENREKAILLIWVLSSILIISTILAQVMPVMPRYMIFLLIPFYLGISVSYHGIMQEISKKPVPARIKDPQALVIIVLILALFFASAPFLIGFYTEYSKENWKGFSQDLQNKTRNGDIVVLIPGYLESPFDYYYVNSTDFTIEKGANTLEEVTAIQCIPGETIYYVLTSDVYAVDPSGKIPKWLDENTRFVSNTSDGIYLYRSLTTMHVCGT